MTNDDVLGDKIPVQQELQLRRFCRGILKVGPLLILLEATNVFLNLFAFAYVFTYDFDFFVQDMQCENCSFSPSIISYYV